MLRERHFKYHGFHVTVRASRVGGWLATVSDTADGSFVGSVGAASEDDAVRAARRFVDERRERGATADDEGDFGFDVATLEKIHQRRASAGGPRPVGEAVDLALERAGVRPSGVAAALDDLLSYLDDDAGETMCRCEGDEYDHPHDRGAQCVFCRARVALQNGEGT